MGISARVAAQTDDPRITKIFADWKKRQDAIKVVRYRLEGKSVIPKGSFVDRMMKPLPEPTPGQDIEAKLTRSLLVDFVRGRIRIERDDPEYDEESKKVYPAVTIKTFDGKTGKQWRPRELNTNPRSDLTPTTAELGVGTGYLGGTSLGAGWRPLFLGHGSVACEGIVGVTMTTLLVLPDREEVFVHGEGVHQGRACWVVRTQARKAGSISFTELWVDKGRDSAIVRHAYLMTGGVPREEYDIEYRQTKQGWLAAKWTYTSRNLWNKGSVRRLESLAVVAATVDPPLEDAEFDIAIQPGMLTAEINYSEPKPGEPPYRATSETTLIRIDDDGGRQKVEIVDGVERIARIGSSQLVAYVLVAVAASCLSWFVWRLARRRGAKR